MLQWSQRVSQCYSGHNMCHNVTVVTTCVTMLVVTMLQWLQHVSQCYSGYNVTVVTTCVIKSPWLHVLQR